MENIVLVGGQVGFSIDMKISCWIYEQETIEKNFRLVWVAFDKSKTKMGLILHGKLANSLYVFVFSVDYDRAR